MREKFICGNWKMYKTMAEAEAFARKFKELYINREVRSAVCAPFTQLKTISDIFAGTGIGVGAQNCHFEAEGAFTGEISIPMLKELGVRYCIVGHSERRRDFNESDETVNKKITALLDEDIIPILCVGEDLYQREHNYQDRLVAEQVKNALKDIPDWKAARTVIAYEPIWAIGTGRTATPIQANHMCGVIRDKIREIYGDEIAELVTVLYGGSVKPENAHDIMSEEEIDGALVGGASLDPEKFMEIIDF